MKIKSTIISFRMANPVSLLFATMLMVRHVNGEDKELTQLSSYSFAQPRTMATYWLCPMKRVVYLSLGQINQTKYQNVRHSPVLPHIPLYLTEETVYCCCRLGEYHRSFYTHRNAVVDIKWSKDDSSILSSGGDGKLRIMDVESDECLGTFIGHRSIMKSANWHPTNPRKFSSPHTYT